MLTRESVSEIVEIFYQPTFRTFYVNSTDGKTFIKPVGVFVSLGMTTSMRSLDNIKSILGEKYNAEIVEISSKKEGSQFLNTVTRKNISEQYKLPADEYVLSKDQAEAELAKLKGMMGPDAGKDVIETYAHRIVRLQELIKKLDLEDWRNHRIQLDPETGDYKIFHIFGNYKKEGDLEYRIGIFVSEK